MSSASPSTPAGPAYTCTWEGCGRTYRRLGHMERHRQTHASSRTHSCALCGKDYSRSDTLSRHLARAHGQSHSRIGRPRKVVCVRCIRNHSACDGQPPLACSRCAEQNAACQYRDRSPRSSRSPTSRWPGSRPASPGPSASPGRPLLPVRHLLPEQPPLPGPSPPYPIFASSPALPPMPNAPVPAPLPAPAPPGATSDDLLSLFLSAAGSDGGEFWHYNDMDQNLWLGTGADPPAPSLTPALDWLFPEPFAPLGALSPDTPTGLPAALGAPGDADITKAVQPDDETSGELHDGQPKGNIWPNVYVPKSPSAAIDLPASRPPSPRAAVASQSRHVSAASRRSMITLGEYTHRHVWPEPNLARFPSATTLTALVDLYLVHFAPWLPILDAAGSAAGSATATATAPLDATGLAPIVLQAMAAVGAVYGDEATQRLGLSINEIVRREILWTCEHDERFILETSVIQSSVLHAFYSLYNGSPRLFRQAEAARSSLVTTCRRLNLLHTRYSAVGELLRRGASGSPSAQDMARARRQDHLKLHLGWAILLLDAQLACFFGISSQFFLPFIHAPFPTVPAPFPTLPASSPPWFADAMATLLDTGVFPSDLSDFGLSCLAYSLYRVCLETAEMVYFSTTPHTKLTPGAFPFYRHHPQDLLEQLAQHVLRTSSSHMPLRISCVALSYHSHLSFGGIGLMDKVKVAAGKTGDPRRRADARAFFETWMGEHPVAAREIFAHAVMLWSLMNRFTSDSPTEVVWLFDATVWIWAYLLFSPTPFATMGPHASPLLLGWTKPGWFDHWIASGLGEISMQGLGGGTALSLSIILTGASDRLALLSWGLAAKYRLVVDELLQEVA